MNIYNYTSRSLALFVFLLMLLVTGQLRAQSITFDNVPPLTGGGNTAGGQAFNLTVKKPVIIQGIRGSFSTVSGTVTLWYNPVKINGQPTINAANGWINLGSASMTGISPGTASPTPQTVPVPISLPMNPGDTFGFMIQWTGNVYPTTNTTIPTFSDANVTIIADASCAYTSNAAMTTWFTPRQINGGVVYKLANKPNNDASISQLVSSLKFCGSSQPITVKVSNLGKNIINNVNVDWTLDGVPQATIPISTPLDTPGHPTNISELNVPLGTPSFLPNQVRSIVVWTSGPNGGVDTVTNNDTLRFTIRRGLNGTYTIKGISPDFNSFTDAVNSIDSFGRCGPVVFNVTSGTTYTERPIIIRNIDSLTFQKFGPGANPIVYGVTGIGTIDAVIALGGARNITIDGIDVADDVSNLTPVTQMEYGYGVVNNSNNSVLTGSSNNVIKNCKITLKRSYTSTIGIAQSTLTTATSLTAANHNNRYENIRVENSYAGILLQGTAAFPDSNNVITSTGGDTTIIGASTPNDIGNGTAVTYGIECAEQRNVEVSRCTVRNVTHTASLIGSGIWLSNTAATTDYGTAKIFNNTVYNINRTTIATGVAAAAMIGIRIEVALLARAVVYNNIVFGMSSANTTASVATAQTLRGISHGQSTGTGVAEYYHNSVSLDNTNAATSVVGFWKGGTSNCIVRNNIFSVASVANTSTAKHHAIYLNAGTLTASQNVYWSSPTTNGFLGFATSDRSMLAHFAAATSPLAPADGNEQGSAFTNPNFTSSTNLDFSAATPAANSGTPITTPVSITTDINGNPRSSTAPSIGAFETTQTLFDSAAPVISNVLIKSGSVPSIYATIKDNSAPFSAGSVNLWFRSGTTGAFAALAPDSTPVGAMNGTYKWGASLTSLPVGIYQFYISARDLSGPGLNIAVNPIQASGFTNFGASDPANYASNPDAAVTTRTFTKTSVLPGGTYTVGASSPTYIKLKDVANALNTAEITGNIVFELQSDYDGTTGETFPIAFNPLVTTGGNWTVTIRPAASVTGRETSGYPASAVPLIQLNGADRITFDGRAGGTGSTSAWTIRAKRSAASTNSPCVQLNNGAQRNTLQYLTIETDNTTTTSGAIVIGTTSTSDGNSFNRIQNNTIGSRTDSAGVTAVGIYAAGTAGATNDSNIISNNNLANWGTTGVFITSTGNGANWQINANHLYMTAAQTTAQTSIRFEAGTAATGTRINGNFIGGTAINAGGTAWTNSVAGAWRGIVCAASLTDSVQIQNNTIQNISLTGGTGTYAAIEMTGALASIRNNTIGHATTANSIQTSQLGTIISIWLNNAANQALIEGNTIANVNSTGNTTAVGHNGIRITTAVTTAPLIIRNNTINNLNALNPTTSTTTASMIGILSQYAGTLQTIEQNTIYALSNGAQASTNVFGINVTNTAGAGTISGNSVYNLNNTSNTATSQVVGIHLDLGTSWTVVNNMVALGSNIDSSAIVSGIVDKTTGTNNIITFNSVLISGNAQSTAATLSHAYRRTTTATTSIRNNIFQNVRTGGTANYAIANANATPATGWSANYNVLNAATLSQVGLWNATPTDFSSWKTTSLYDTASINTAATFVSTTDLHILAPTIGNVAFAGRPMAGITKDFDGQTRNSVTPYMGADEIPGSPLPVSLVTFTARKQQSDVIVSWTTASETNAAYFELERSLDGKSFGAIHTMKASGNSNTLLNYRYTDAAVLLTKTPAIYYRLKMVDEDGAFDYAETQVIANTDKTTAPGIAVYPNPFNNEVNISFESPVNGNVTVEVFDATGKLLVSVVKTAIEGNNTIGLNELRNEKAGLFFVSITTAENRKLNATLIKQ